MSEYEMPIEEQVKSIAKELRAMSEAMREGFAGVDARFDAVDTRFDAVDTRLDAVDTRLGAVDTRLSKLQVSVEETNATAKLGLEGLDGLRESMDEKFAEVKQTHKEQTALLKSAIVHVRKRVERVERPQRRRRS